jgi:hypothetical protein
MILENYKVNGGIGLISVSLLVQGPIKKKTASFIVAGRTSMLIYF